jgi:adenosylcobinamide-phosphate synthase
MLRDHGKTESPNAGWTMSAMAGALRTRLEKRGYYTLGDSNNPLSNQLIGSGVRLLDISVLLWISLYLIMVVMFFVFII